MSFDGFFLHHMVNELQSELLYGRIKKLTNPLNKSWFYKFVATCKNQKLLLSSHSVFWTDPTDPDQLRESCLPQYLYHGHAQVSPRAVIEQIQQLENDRILEIAVSNKNEIGDDISVTLIIEIMGKHSNIILLDKATGKIIKAIKHVGFSQNSYRTILPGSTYLAPPKPMRSTLLQSRTKHYSPFSHREELTPKTFKLISRVLVEILLKNWPVD